jgi:hypothetical protein
MARIADQSLLWIVSFAGDRECFLPDDVRCGSCESAMRHVNGHWEANSLPHLADVR